MLYNFKSQAIVAKARAIYGRRLTEDDYKQLVMKTSVSEVCAYLKNTDRYSKILSSVNERTVHRGQVENLIRRNNFRIYEKLYVYDNKSNDDFYTYYLQKVQIKEILNAIMFINAGKDDDYITSFPAFLMAHSEIDLIKLAKANTFDELLGVIKNTRYYKVLKPFAKNGSTKVDFLACEKALYTDYYKNLLEVIQKSYGKKTAAELRQAILMKVDLYNIMAAFRMRVMFNIEPEKIISAMIPIKNKVSKKQMDELLELKTAKEMAEQMPTLAYFKDIPQIHSGSIEASVRITRGKAFGHLLRKSASAPVIVYALLELLETETQNVTTIIEGVRYSITPDEIEQMIVTF